MQILVIEDDKRISDFLIKGLEEKSYIIRKRQGKTTFFEFNEDLTEESV